ncbi:MAG: hypothetical protein JW734_06975 [Candidatus Omnitrophica bacterium]|nr:hypothetical protein [Candidatus Omnitrophota bacterium]
MSRFVFEIAKKADNKALQEILLNSPMQGRIRMVFQRQPDFFQASMVGNAFSQTLVVRDMYKEKVVGLGSRSIRRLYVNGVVSDVGYLSDLRIGRSYRKGTLLARGYKHLLQLHNDKKTPIYLSTIAGDNTNALKTLTSRRGNLPVYYYFGHYYSVAIGAFRKKNSLGSGSVKIIRGSHELIDGIVDCLHRNGAKKQFYPFYSKEDFILKKSIVKGFCIEDFFVAIKDGKIVGVAGKWDQRSLRQVMILGYNGPMRIFKPIFNFAAKIMGFAPLPDKGQMMNSFFLSFIAIDNNDIDIFRLLLRAAYNFCLEAKYSYFVVGLHSRDPLLAALRGYYCIKYTTDLYIVCWPDGESAFSQLDNRTPYLEVGTL